MLLLIEFSLIMYSYNITLDLCPFPQFFNKFFELYDFFWFMRLLMALNMKFIVKVLHCVLILAHHLVKSWDTRQKIFWIKVSVNHSPQKNNRILSWDLQKIGQKNINLVVVWEQNFISFQVREIKLQMLTSKLV